MANDDLGRIERVTIGAGEDSVSMTGAQFARVLDRATDGIDVARVQSMLQGDVYPVPDTTRFLAGEFIAAPDLEVLGEGADQRTRCLDRRARTVAQQQSRTAPAHLVVEIQVGQSNGRHGRSVCRSRPWRAHSRTTDERDQRRSVGDDRDADQDDRKRDRE